MISVPSILRSGVNRFIPGVVVFLLGALVLSASLKDTTIGPSQIAGFTELTLSMLAGYVAFLVVGRRRVARTANLAGWRAALAGFTATVVLLGVDTLHGSPLSRPLNLAFALLAGAAMAATFFGPFMMKRARSELQAEELDVIEAAESVLGDRSPLARAGRSTQATRTPRQVSPVRAD